MDIGTGQGESSMACKPGRTKMGPWRASGAARHSITICTGRDMDVGERQGESSMARKSGLATMG